MKPDLELIPLKLNMEGCATLEEMNANVAATLERGHTRLNEYLGAYSGSLAICGSGPSLRETYTELKGDVLAINSAIGWLLERGVVPKFGMIWDAHPVCATFAVPHPEITYLVGARCHPSVFERLQGCRRIEWHAGGDHNISDFLATRGVNEPLVNGGSAGVTRALYLGAALGYRDFNLYGADSSLSDDGKTHITQSALGEKIFRAWVTYQTSGTPFITTPEFAAQTEEYLVIAGYFEAMGMRCAVHGGGMLGHVDALRERQRADNAMLKAA